MMNIKQYLSEAAIKNNLDPNAMLFPDCEIDPVNIKAIMINEVVPQNPGDWFYSDSPDCENRRTAFGLFEGAGVSVKNIQDVLDMGIYITAALKTPKEGYTADPAMIKAQLPLLEAELSLFSDLKVIMLMGDIAKKMFNMVVKSKTKKNLIPSVSTYRIRMNDYYWDNIRVFPNYIMTGKNLLIEKGKCDMISEDIRRMMEMII